MELLSKDVLVIISRLLYDYNYAILKDQYRTKWLTNRWASSVNSVFWDDSGHFFRDSFYLRANYRVIRNQYMYYDYYIRDFTRFDGGPFKRRISHNY